MLFPKHFFLKENNAAAFPGMFEAEKKGLDLLKKAGAFIVPEVISLVPSVNWRRMTISSDK